MYTIVLTKVTKNKDIYIYIYIVRVVFRWCTYIVTVATSGAGNPNPSEAHEFTLRFVVGFALRDLLFSVYCFYIVVYAMSVILLAIVLSLRFRFTDSDYLFVIFKFFLSPPSYSIVTLILKGTSTGDTNGAGTAFPVLYHLLAPSNFIFVTA
jgi:hypothetical protein